MSAARRRAFPPRAALVVDRDRARLGAVDGVGRVMPAATLRRPPCNRPRRQFGVYPIKDHGLDPDTLWYGSSVRLDAAFQLDDPLRHAIELRENDIPRLLRYAGGLQSRFESAQISLPMSTKLDERPDPRRWSRRAGGIEHGLI